jgi:HAD superfamily hydrolase (TIGR01549 family)
MIKAAIFDVDGTLIDSVDLHALAWQDALRKFGHDVSFEDVRGQIGKGGDKLIPVFLSDYEQREFGEEMEAWRSAHFKATYLPLVRPFSAVPDLLRRLRDIGLRVAVASSAKKDELHRYLEIARIIDLVEVTTSSDDVEESKPAPDIFEVALEKLKLVGAEAIAIGDTPYDAEAAGKAGVVTIGVLCGGFAESTLRRAGCTEIYPGPAALFARLSESIFGKALETRQPYVGPRPAASQSACPADPVAPRTA